MSGISTVSGLANAAAAGTLTVDGLISGLDTTKLIDSLIAVERRSVTLLQARQARLQNLTLAYQSLSTRLLSLQAASSALDSEEDFGNRLVTSSDTDVLAVASDGGASVGSYRLAINSLAAAHQIASQGYVDTDNASLGTGSLSISVGGEAATTITLADGSNTLEAVRDAINASAAPVTAAIINTGNPVAPYRLLLTADESGAENAITVETDLTGDSPVEFNTSSVSEVKADSANGYPGTATTSGAYTGSANKVFVVEIVEDGDENSAKYHVSEDGGTTFGSTQTMSGGSLTVGDGITMNFTAGSFRADDRFTVEAFVPTVQAPADATVTLGQGAGAIQISSSSNTISTLIPGLTLSLKGTTASPVTVSVAADTSALTSKVQGFMDAYNNTMSYIRTQTRYDEQTQTAGLLLGDGAVQRVQLDIASIAGGSVSGLPAPLNGLYAIGIVPTETGSLRLDSTELNDVLAGNLPGLMRLFAKTGSSTSPLVTFVDSSRYTTIPANGFEVEITQAATRGAAVGADFTDPAVENLVIGPGSNQLNLIIDGADSSLITLTDGTYTSGAALAAELQARINEDENLGEHNVTVSWVDNGATGHLAVYSNAYGAASTVEMAAAPGNAAYKLGLDAAVSTDGTDVAGTINGETATGSGQILRGDADGETQRLVLSVTVTPDQLAAAGGSLGATVSVTRGIAAQLTERLQALVDPTDGLFKLSEDSFDDQIKSYQDQIDRQEAILTTRRAALVKKFTQMEQALARLNSVGQFLTDQLGAFLNTSG